MLKCGRPKHNNARVTAGPGHFQGGNWEATNEEGDEDEEDDNDDCWWCQDLWPSTAALVGFECSWNSFIIGSSMEETMFLMDSSGKAGVWVCGRGWFKGAALGGVPCPCYSSGPNCWRPLASQSLDLQGVSWSGSV